jgi:GNAT superfamily N-acetyltransferase
VVGYLLGCIDTRGWQSEFRVALRHMLTRFLWARPDTAAFWWRAGFDVVRDLGRGNPSVDLDRYPAHVHCNLLPEAREKGIGLALFSRWHELLHARGVPGVYGETLASNAAVHAVLGKLGWEKFGAEYPVPALRTQVGERVYGQLVVCDLSGGAKPAREPVSSRGRNPSGPGSAPG